jgi:hypothetical protein
MAIVKNAANCECHGLLSLATICYIASFFVPAVNICNEWIFGFLALFCGWAVLPWYANVIGTIALVGLLNRKYRFACVLYSMAALVAFSTLFVCGFRDLLIGYYLWQSSMIIAAVGSGRTAHLQRVALNSGNFNMPPFN